MNQLPASLDSSLLSDALDALGLSGVVAGIRRQVGRGRAAGPAITIELAACEPASSGRGHLGARALDAADPGSVVVVANAGRTTSAAWGGLLTRAARRRGIAGVVIDGLCRDIDEIETLGLPIFSRGVTPVTARGRVVESGFNEPISIDSVTIAPGDWIVADGSGVIVAPRRHLVAIRETAERLALAEARLIDSLDRGRDVSDVLDERYERLAAGRERGA